MSGISRLYAVARAGGVSHVADSAARAELEYQRKVQDKETQNGRYPQKPVAALGVSETRNSLGSSSDPALAKPGIVSAAAARLDARYNRAQESGMSQPLSLEAAHDSMKLGMARPVPQVTPVQAVLLSLLGRNGGNRYKDTLRNTLNLQRIRGW